MKKFFTLISIVIFLTANIFAQNDDFTNRYKDITDTVVINKLKSEISETFKKIEDIECNYLMHKAIPMFKSFPDTKGTMKYKKSKPFELYWSSTTPQKSSFTIKNDSIEFVNAKGNTKISVEEHPIFREVSTIIKSSEKNGSFVDESMFFVTFSKCEGSLYVSLFPNKNRMKKIVEYFYVEMDYNTKTIKSIEVKDPHNTQTIIKLSDVKIKNIR